MDNDSKDLTAFVTLFGTFRFARLPFGLVSAVFQRALENVLKNLTGVRIYQDDIIIFGRDNREHDERVLDVLSRLNDYNLTVKIEKCKFRKESIDYLGHSSSAGGVMPKEDRVDTICKLHSPTNKEELMSFF